MHAIAPSSAARTSSDCCWRRVSKALCVTASTHLVSADALVLAHSTLSDLAAFLSDAPRFGVAAQDTAQLRYAHVGRPRIAPC